jgi:hypothetical protein
MHKARWDKAGIWWVRVFVVTRLPLKALPNDAVANREWTQINANEEANAEAQARGVKRGVDRTEPVAPVQDEASGEFIRVHSRSFGGGMVSVG